MTPLLSANNHGASSPAIRSDFGFTLAELLVSMCVMSIVLSSLCGIYFATAQEWQRQYGQNDALVATSQTCSRISDYVSQAVGAAVVTRFFANDTLLLNMPADQSGADYAPVWSGGKMQYRSGSWIAFYLSDSTGSALVNGDILWSGRASWAAGVYTITPDSDWSLYYGSQKGRIAPLTSLRFALDESGARPLVTITAVSTFPVGQTQKQTSMSKAVCLRNTN
jgi:prepilin-type N-terminal cleavage/methylation domain-containing protein